jgi:hypothetical protein
MSDRFVYDDGGRAAAGYKGHTRDCVTRAIAIACELDYQEVYDALNYAKSNPGKVHEKTRRMLAGTSARTGINKRTSRQFLEDLGWAWVPTMEVGTGCKVHLLREELPSGRIIAKCSRHLVAVIDGVIHDTHDSSYSRWSGAGKRCVYGIYYNPKEPGRILGEINELRQRVKA